MAADSPLTKAASTTPSTSPSPSSFYDNSSDPMAPAPFRKSVARDRFPTLFSTLKPQIYHDPSSRGTGSHTIRTIAWSPTGTFIATGSANRTLRIWSPASPLAKNSTVLGGHTGQIERVAWNPVKEAELVSVSSDGTARFWDVRAKKCVGTVQLGGEGFSIVWMGSGEGLLVGRKDDVLVEILWESEGQKDGAEAESVEAGMWKKGRELAQGIQTNELGFSHTRPPRHLLLTRGDGSVTIASWPEMKTLHTLHAHTSSCLALQLSPSGRYLAIGGSDALLSLYDTTDWVCRRTITSLVGAVKSVSFSFDGSYVLGGCDEGNALEVVHVETGEVMGKVDVGGNVGAGQVAWHPSRYWIAYAGEGGGLRILGAAGGQL